MRDLGVERMPQTADKVFEDATMTSSRLRERAGRQLLAPGFATWMSQKARPDRDVHARRPEGKRLIGQGFAISWRRVPFQGEREGTAPRI